MDRAIVRQGIDFNLPVVWPLSFLHNKDSTDIRFGIRSGHRLIDDYLCSGGKGTKSHKGKNKRKNSAERRLVIPQLLQFKIPVCII